MLFGGTFYLNSCIGDDIIDDFVEPSFRIIAKVDSLSLGNNHQFAALYTNNIGLEESVAIQWTSSNENVLTIDVNGLAMGVGEGQVIITATIQQNDETLIDETAVVVADEMVTNVSENRSGAIRTTSSYELEGSFELSESDGNLTLSFKEDYKASSALPGLYVYLTNNPNSINGAYEIGEVEVFNGVHSYVIPQSDVSLNQFNHLLYFCKPFRVKVGDGDIN